MSAGPVAIVPRCEECGARWPPGDEERWQARRVDVERDDEPAIGFYCPRCAQREFLDNV